jgi:hypothetical protein
MKKCSFADASHLPTEEKGGRRGHQQVLGTDFFKWYLKKNRDIDYIYSQKRNKKFENEVISHGFLSPEMRKGKIVEITRFLYLVF